MSDRYQQLVNTPIGKIVSKQIGLPGAGQARALRARAAGHQRPRAVRRGAAEAASPARSPRCSPRSTPRSTPPLDDDVRTAAADAGRVAPACSTPTPRPRTSGSRRCVFDASGIADSSQLHEAYAFFHPHDPPRPDLGPGDRARHPARRRHDARVRPPRNRLSRGSCARSARRSARARPLSWSTSARRPRTRSSRRCASTSRRSRPT